MESWFGVRTEPVKVMITMLDGTFTTIGASRDAITSISQLPFALTDACVESGFPELRSLSIVDLCIAKKAEMSYETKAGDIVPINATTVTSDLIGVKSLRVRVLAA